MSLACPSCQQPIAVKAPKPGRFKVNCARCGWRFALFVADDLSMTVGGLAEQTAVGVAPSEAKGADSAPPGPIPVARLITSNDLPATRVGSSDPPKARTGPPPVDAERDEHVPEVLGKYDIVKRIGKGGMGAVYLARQRSLDRPVAIKIINPRWADNPRFLVRFTREAFAAAQLVHHNIVQVYDLGTDDGIHWFSMEYVDGTTLGALVLKHGRVDPRTAAGYILQAARGLQFAHQRGMVHRDIKPDNLMLNKQGIVKVADLGLVRTPGASDELETSSPAAQKQPGCSDGSLSSLAGVTLANQTMGTPAYMAPEQTRDAMHVDARADIYSLGCTLYVLITGRPVFRAKSAPEMFEKHQKEPITPPNQLVQTVPATLSAIVCKMLQKDPARRYQSAAELVTALEDFLELGTGAPATFGEEQVTTLQNGARAFRNVPSARLRPLCLAGGVAFCALAALISLLVGVWFTAGAFVGLLVVTHLAYFVVHGVNTRAHLFLKAREFVLGCSWVDGVKAGIMLVLFALVVYLLGLFLAWLLVCVIAVGLAFLPYFLLDRPIIQQRQGALADVEKMLMSLRLRGVSEEAIQQYVCKFAGEQWEEVFEELFGYDAKLAARGKWGAGPKGPRPKFAGWRDPLVRWIDGRQRARHEALERKHLQAIEEQRFVAEGMAPAEAQRKAEQVADAMVEMAAEIKHEAQPATPSRTSPVFWLLCLPFRLAVWTFGLLGTAFSRMRAARKKALEEAAIPVAEPVEEAVPGVPIEERPARPLSRPRPRVDLGKMSEVAEQPARVPVRRGVVLEKLESMVLGGGVRLAIGAVLICIPIAWVHSTGVLDVLRDRPVYEGATWADAWPKLTQAGPLEIPLLPALAPMACVAAGAAGLLLVITALQPIRRSALLHYAAAAFIIAGPQFGVPAVEGLSPEVVCMAGGAAFSLFVMVLTRMRQ